LRLSKAVLARITVSPNLTFLRKMGFLTGTIVSFVNSLQQRLPDKAPQQRTRSRFSREQTQTSIITLNRRLKKRRAFTGLLRALMKLFIELFCS
jgi:hypothetical protein